LSEARGRGGWWPRNGTEGGARFSNVGGSFYDFEAVLFRGTSAEVIASPPDAWGGRALQRWARRVAAGEGHDDREAEELLATAHVLDAIYGRARAAG
jgi:hypothetical protein